MQNTEENLMYLEVDNFNYHNYVSFGFKLEHVEQAVLELLNEQFEPGLIEENYDDLVDEIGRQYSEAEKTLSQLH